MRRLVAILAITVAVLSGCTRNDGDIGPLFGLWQMSGREVKGVDAAEPLAPVEELFWAFQSSVIEMKHVYGTSRYEYIYGKWSLQGETLTLNFPDPGQPILEEFLLPRQCELEVLELDGRSLRVVWRPESGGEVIYKFIKR